MTIQDLKELGYEVDVNHHRRLRHTVTGQVTSTGPAWARYLDEEIDPYGGATIVDIFDKDGNCLATGVAEVYHKDRFCKRIGLQVALGRAIYQLDLKDRRSGASANEAGA